MKIDIISGFLGTGKTTLINKLLPVLAPKEKIALIENEYGSIQIDGSLLPGNLPMREIYSGCICCTLQTDFVRTIEEIDQTIQPERIIIEPTGIGQLSDVITACQKAKTKDPLEINELITLVDISQFADYVDGFGDFYTNQIKNAHVILLSYFAETAPELIQSNIEKIKMLNPDAIILAEDWFHMAGDVLWAKLRQQAAPEIAEPAEDISEHHHEEEEASCCCHHHGHDHAHGHQHQHHGHHHEAINLMFDAWGKKDLPCYTMAEMEALLQQLREKRFGHIARGKGMAQTPEGKWFHFDFTPGHIQCRWLTAPLEDLTSKITIIGTVLNEVALEQLFQK